MEHAIELCREFHVTEATTDTLKEQYDAALPDLKLSLLEARLVEAIDAPKDEQRSKVVAAEEEYGLAEIAASQAHPLLKAKAGKLIMFSG